MGVWTRCTFRNSKNCRRCGVPLSSGWRPITNALWRSIRLCDKCVDEVKDEKSPTDGAEMAFVDDAKIDRLTGQQTRRGLLRGRK